MCITVALAIASTAVSVVGAVQQANAQKAQAEYSAAVARNNSIISAQNEADIIQRGKVALDMQQRRLGQTIGAARAGIAGSGLLLDDTSGSTAAGLLDDVTVAGQFDIMTMKTNIDREARRASIQGANFEAQAGLFDLQASSISPGLAGLNAGLSGASSTYKLWGGSSGSALAPTTSIRPQARPATLMS